MINIFSIFRKKITIQDKLQYLIPSKVINDTEKVLTDYAKLVPSNEGFVYWAGKKNGKVISVSAVIAPKTESNYGRVSTSHSSNFEFVKELNKRKLVEIGQVHTHPDNMVDHSLGDDKWAPFKIEGLVSIVVPNYCLRGMMPLHECGVHRYQAGRFIRLSDNYLKKQFKIQKNGISDFVDLRK